jgi:mannose-6-phosphate isomerase
VTQIPPLSPARLEPTFVPRIWGVKSLAPLFPEKKELSERIGEVWLSGNDSRFATGPFAGRTVADAWREMPQEWAGTQSNTREPFPILTKFLFPGEKLSVQVHPDDEYARKHESAAGGVGKTEAWYIVAAESDASINVGVRPGVTRESFRRAIADGTVENCLAKIPVAKGEAIFVPAGTAHTIGPGLVICEVQENSDLTYRVHDYGRRNPDGSTRPLHVEKALEVINFGDQRGGKQPPAMESAPGSEVEHFVACRYFALEKWELSAPVTLTTDRAHFELWITLAGRGKIRWESADSSAPETADLGPGHAWFIPAALGRWNIDPQTPVRILRVYKPDLRLYAEQLSRAGLSAAQIAQTIRK